ncbi:MAG TPA: hypothetical protein VGD80_39900 [Kofleriaceae bacterium]
MISLAAELGHSAGDRAVEAAIERVELVDADRLLLLPREFGDRLAQISVVVNDLIDGEALPEELAAVQRGCAIDVRAERVRIRRRLGRRCQLLGPEHLDQLVDQDGDATPELGRRRRGRRPRGHLGLASSGQLGPVTAQKRVQHAPTLAPDRHALSVTFSATAG